MNAFTPVQSSPPYSQNFVPSARSTPHDPKIILSSWINTVSFDTIIIKRKKIKRLPRLVNFEIEEEEV